MNTVLNRTFGGLSPKYYFRHLVFGIALAALVIYAESQAPRPFQVSFALFSVVSTLLYPYSRFVYESVVRFIMGGNVFLVNALFMLMAKLITMAMCWAFSIVVAPIGLAYLYYHHRRTLS